jgi:hypothetical protein
VVGFLVEEQRILEEVELHTLVEGILVVVGSLVVEDILVGVVRT